MELVETLQRLGYHLEADGANIRFRYTRPGKPPPEARPLLRELQARKPEALDALRGTAREPAPGRLGKTLPPELSANLAAWPLERRGLWRSRVAEIIGETRWPLARCELTAYWDVQRWGLFLDPDQPPPTLH